MRTISIETLAILNKDGFMTRCSRRIDGGCRGNITWEHAIIFAGQQVDCPWAIIPLCSYHHNIGPYQNTGGMIKEINECVALNRATEKELESVSKIENYKNKRDLLNKKYNSRYSNL